MIFRCPNCAAALVFDPDQGRLVCKRCDSTFRPEELEQQDADETIIETEDPDAGSVQPKRMRCHIFTCTACGAEVMINDVEASTFCIYCGQPTVVFSRISSQLRPDYIIPFGIRKEVVSAVIRRGLRKKFFVPKNIRNFQTDALRGIYVPFRLYDIDYRDRQYFSVQTKSHGGPGTVSKGYCREAVGEFTRLGVAASRTLADEALYSMESLYALEPFYQEEMVPFAPGYLSGFYADCPDLDWVGGRNMARFRAQEYFDWDMRERLNERGVQEANRESTSPRVIWKETVYALFPVYFLTFRHHGEAYTLFVNGQTGKLTGSLPADQSRTAFLIGGLTLLLAVPFSAFGALCCLAMQDTAKHPLSHSILFTVFAYLVLLLPGLLLGRYFRALLKKGIRYTKSGRIHKYVKERQEG